MGQDGVMENVSGAGAVVKRYPSCNRFGGRRRPALKKDKLANLPLIKYIYLEKKFASKTVGAKTISGNWGII